MLGVEHGCMSSTFKGGGECFITMPGTAKGFLFSLITRL